MAHYFPLICLFLVVILSTIFTYICIIFSFFHNLLKLPYSMKFSKLQKLSTNKRGKDLLKLLIVALQVVGENNISFVEFTDLSKSNIFFFKEMHIKIFELLEILAKILNIKSIKKL